jgi:hypothetical protein
MRPVGKVDESATGSAGFFVVLQSLDVELRACGDAQT